LINSAQVSFAIGCGFGFYAPDLPALGKVPPMSTEGFVPKDIASAATIMRTGYTFTLKGTPLESAPATCNGLAVGATAPGYVATADPLDPQLVPRFLGTNADGLLYEHTATLNGVMPEMGPPAAGKPLNK
jgi:hypothetical protein